MAFNGNWKVSRFEGMSGVFEAYGVDASLRDPTKLQGASVNIKQDGDTITFNATGGLGKKGSHTYIVGQPAEGELFGKTYSGPTRWEGDVLVFKGKTGIVLKRSIEGGQLVYTMEFGGKTGRIYFTK